MGRWAVTLLSFEGLEIETDRPPETAERRQEKAGYGNCIVCGCGGYYDAGNGDCSCGHSFGQHYS